jgi:hypothetical protein
MPLALLVQPLALPHPSEDPVQVLTISFLFIPSLLRDIFFFPE